MSIGYRLRVVRLVPTTGGQYGSKRYGDDTYGPRATDTADLQRYEIVPTSVSPSQNPMLFGRVGDVSRVFECWLIAFATEYENAERSGVKLDLSGVASAVMRLDRVSEGEPVSYEAPMDVVLPDRLRRTFAGLVTEQGTYAAHIKVTFDTGREYTLPIDDSMMLVFTPSHEPGVVMP